MRKAKRHLQQDKVWMAEEVQHRRIKKIQEVLSERVKKDANLAKEMLDAIGKVLPPELRKDAEESVAKAKANIDAEAAEKLKSLEPTVEQAGKDYLPIDPLIEMNAPESDYPENQGMGNAFKDYLTPDPLNGNVGEELKSV